MITNKFYKKEKLLENEKYLAKQKLTSKAAMAAETTGTVGAAVQKTLTQNQQNIPRSSQQNDKSKIAKPPFYLQRIFWHSPVWNIQLDFFPTLNWEKIPVWNIKFNIHFKSVGLVYIYTQAQIQPWIWITIEIIRHYCLETS